MYRKFITSLIALGLFTVLASGTGFGQERAKTGKKEVTRNEHQVPEQSAQRVTRGPSFYIAAFEGDNRLFSVLLSDGNGKTVSGSFTLQQIDVFEAVLEAAKAFALTDEKVGSGEPIITRLMEQHEWSLFVDVSKKGNQSRFYVSLITLHGKLTAEAGEIIRGSKKEPSALLLKILSQVQNAKAGIKPGMQ
ncbi:MAG: hypothetical protein AABO57_19710 [Acidobacteriota bacterium]